MPLHSALVLVASPISTVCSCTIIYTLFKSRDKLTTTLNRLVFGLSVGDIMQSLPMIFSTVVVPPRDVLWLPVTSSQVGCNVQGFFIIAGGVLGPFYNCALCFYYLAVVRYNMSDNDIRKKLEPFLHGVPFIWSVASATYAVAVKAVNPNVVYCWINQAPYTCLVDPNIPCERGANAVRLRWALLGGPIIVIFFLILTIMTLMYLSFWRQEKRMASRGFRSSMTARAAGEVSMIAGQNSTKTAKSFFRRPVSNSSMVMNQATAYVCAYLCSYLLVLINGFILLDNGEYDDTVTKLAVFFHPLQGFFNLIVFMFPRVISQLRANANMNIFQAIVAAIQCTPTRTNRGLTRGNRGPRTPGPRTPGPRRGSLPHPAQSSPLNQSRPPSNVSNSETSKLSNADDELQRYIDAQTLCQELASDRPRVARRSFKDERSNADARDGRNSLRSSVWSSVFDNSGTSLAPIGESNVENTCEGSDLDKPDLDGKTNENDEETGFIESEAEAGGIASGKMWSSDLVPLPEEDLEDFP